MTNKRIENKPSETALFAALRRTLAHKEYQNEKFGPDNLAEYFLPPHFRFFLKFRKIRENTKNKLNTFLPGLNYYMIARTAYFDELFVNALNNRTSQIVLLGAGYDSRAYRYAHLNHETTVFELDSTPTQERKKKYIQKARLPIPETIIWVPVDFNKESLKDVLKRAGYKGDQKTLFIWEGVSYYLEKESVETTLLYVGHDSHPESAIAFDYTVSISDEKVKDGFGVKEFTETMKTHHDDEVLKFSLREGEIESFLAQFGLKMVDHLNNTEIEKTYLIDNDNSRLGHITGHFRFVLASPENQ